MQTAPSFRLKLIALNKSCSFQEYLISVNSKILKIYKFKIRHTVYTNMKQGIVSVT